MYPMVLNYSDIYITFILAVLAALSLGGCYWGIISRRHVQWGPFKHARLDCCRPPRRHGYYTDGHDGKAGLRSGSEDSGTATSLSSESLSGSLSGSKKQMLVLGRGGQRQRWTSWLIVGGVGVALAFLVGYLVMCLLFAILVPGLLPSMLFTGDPEGDFASLPPGAMAVTFADSVGDVLHGYYINASLAGYNGTVEYVGLYNHGSGTNIAAEFRRERYLNLASLGISFLVYDYPGYGQSLGVASEESLYRAADAALTFLKAHTRRSESQLLNIGRSLGGAVAVRLSSKFRFQGTLLQSTFTSLSDVVPYYVGLSIGGWVARSTLSGMFPSEARMGGIAGCLYLYQGSDDEQVAPDSAHELWSRAAAADKECTRVVTQPDVLHGDAMTSLEITTIHQWLASIPP